jgi:hypothetical protein
MVRAGIGLNLIGMVVVTIVSMDAALDALLLIEVSTVAAHHLRHVAGCQGGPVLNIKFTGSAL